MICQPVFAQTTYYIDAPWLPWLWPGLALLGIAIEVTASLLRKPILLLAGFLLVAAGCYPERDLTLFVGNSLACAGLWYCIR